MLYYYYPGSQPHLGTAYILVAVVLAFIFTRWSR